MIERREKAAAILLGIPVCVFLSWVGCIAVALLLERIPYDGAGYEFLMRYVLLGGFFFWMLCLPMSVVGTILAKTRAKKWIVLGCVELVLELVNGGLALFLFWQGQGI